MFLQFKENQSDFDWVGTDLVYIWGWYMLCGVRRGVEWGKVIYPPASEASRDVANYFPHIAALQANTEPCTPPPPHTHTHTLNEVKVIYLKSFKGFQSNSVFKWQFWHFISYRRILKTFTSYMLKLTKDWFFSFPNSAYLFGVCNRMILVDWIIFIWLFILVIWYRLTQ